MQWDDVRIFLAVTRECTFSAAAKRLGVQVSTVSRRINLLEERLGFDLVDRSVSGYTITQAGAKLRETALVVEKAFLEFAEKSDVPDCDVRGELRIAAIPDMASSVLMPAFARFKLAYPNIQLRIEVNNHNVRLAEREADIALRQTNRPTETLFGTQLTTVASAVYGSVQYANKVSGDLNKATWIGVNCCEYHKAWTHKHCTENAQTFWVDDTSLTAAALHEGLGVAYLPCYLGDSDSNLVRLLEPEPEHSLGLWLLYHKDLRNTERVSLFREHMQKEIGSLTSLFDGRSYQR